MTRLALAQNRSRLRPPSAPYRASSTIESSTNVAADILRVCDERLSSYKRSKRVILRTELFPRTPTGKLLKRELSPWAAEQVTGAAAAEGH